MKLIELIESSKVCYKKLKNNQYRLNFDVSADTLKEFGIEPSSKPKKGKPVKSTSTKEILISFIKEQRSFNKDMITFKENQETFNKNQETFNKNQEAFNNSIIKRLDKLEGYHK